MTRPQTAKSKRDEPQQKRSAILDAAMEVFSEKGFHPATIDEIAERAGVGKGTIYSYFDSKVALFQELLEEILETTYQRTKERVANSEGTLSKLYALADVDHDVVKRYAPLARILLADPSLVISPKFRRMLEHAQMQLNALVANVIRQGQNEGIFSREFHAELAASMVLGAKNGVIFDWLEVDSQRRPDPDQIRKQVVAFVERGLSAS